MITKVSYKESLLKPVGPSVKGKDLVADPIDEDEPNPEDKWCKTTENDDQVEKPFDPCPNIPISKDEFDEWYKPWHAALMVKVMDKLVGLGFMEQPLRRDWAKKYEGDYNHALMEGPWMIAGHYLIVQRWRPFFLSSEKKVRKVTVWIRIPNLSIELYNHRFLWRVGSTIGHMLKIDRTTSIHSRGYFACICVEIDLRKQLVPRISVFGEVLNIEYKSLHQICFSCEKYGHRLDHYNETPVEEPVSQVNADGEEENINSDNQNHVDSTDQNGKSHDSHNQSVSSNNQDPPCFGPWMMVKRPLRRKNDNNNPNNPGSNQRHDSFYNHRSINEEDNQGKKHGSRFNALHEKSALITLEGEPHAEGKSSSITNNWASPNKVQKEKANSQPIQKKVLKQGAGKNPQMGKKPLFNKVGLAQNEKLVKSMPLPSLPPVRWQLLRMFPSLLLNLKILKLKIWRVSL
ncbi:hypothetical protein Ahy_A05g025842 isoform A [Arachis hypogaea]|uniref:Uncharacterized protein n=1 Tax=Arachis hypogaea TaxID=3818 RepID=A0A445D9Q6_ARAHY|nr:hypothetical protein Ahy_A05g025842 isoform A [Arachis hypogaea]